MSNKSNLTLSAFEKLQKTSYLLTHLVKIFQSLHHLSQNIKNN